MVDSQQETQGFLGTFKQPKAGAAFTNVELLKQSLP
jgi:hypothetical protein